MTPAEKLALCRRSYAAFNDGLDIDALLPLYHPECEWRMGSIRRSLWNRSLSGP
jgi:ketosteroid isomerase-like protein